MTMRSDRERATARRVRHGGGLLLMALLASCAAPPRQAPRPAPRPVAPPTPSVLPASPPQADWRDIPLTPGDWSWHGGAGQPSIAQYGLTGQAAAFAMRCDAATREIVFSRGGTLAVAAPMTFTTSFGAFALAAGNGGGQPPAITARAAARDPHMDQLVFSRGRFLVDVTGQPRLVLPAWPEVARVIEDCRA